MGNEGTGFFVLREKQAREMCYKKDCLSDPKSVMEVFSVLKFIFAFWHEQ